MSSRTSFFRGSLTAALFVITITMSFAGDAGAQSATVADDQCKEYRGSCVYKTKCSDGKIGIVGKECTDPRGVTGTCVSYGVCKATSAKDAGGGSMNIGDLSKLMGVLGQVMQALGGGQPGGSSPATDTSGGVNGCVQYYQVSTTTNDPCAYYVPPSVSGSINTDTPTGGVNSNDSSEVGVSVPDLISKILNGTSGTAGDLSGIADPNATGTKVTGGGKVASSTATSTKGVQGELRVLPNGATIIIQNQDVQNNSAIAGFLGSQATGGAAPTGLVASWCRSRPWATNFFSIIIPAVFFDSLCSLRGYAVGQPPQAAGQVQIGTKPPIVQRQPTQPQATSSSMQYTKVPTSPPMTVDIWAVPASVPLGARTTIFWNSKNAQSCVETSPDGSFSHATLSGGGATVPLSGATTFSISCQAPDGTHASDFVTVNLSI